MFRTFIQCAAFLQAVISAVFLIKAGISISVKDMAELSTTKWGYNSAVLKNLTQQRADTRVGFSLLLFSVVLQFLHWLLPFGIDDLGINRKGVILAIVVSIPIGIVAYKLSRYLQQKSYTQAENIFKKAEDDQKQ
ncbi:hypothetical protein KA005_81635 [bacterium]|nr:hypothetical protein [bacterium]